MRISKETNIAYIVTAVVAAIVCWANKLNWWTLFYFPAFYFILWMSVRETKKQDDAIRKAGFFKWNELTEDAKKTFSGINASLKNKREASGTFGQPEPMFPVYTLGEAYEYFSAKTKGQHRASDFYNYLLKLEKDKPLNQQKYQP